MSREMKRPRSLSSSCTHRIGRDGSAFSDIDNVPGDWGNDKDIIKWLRYQESFPRQVTTEKGLEECTGT